MIGGNYTDMIQTFGCLFENFQFGSVVLLNVNNINFVSDDEIPYFGNRCSGCYKKMTAVIIMFSHVIEVISDML